MIKRNETATIDTFAPTEHCNSTQLTQCLPHPTPVVPTTGEIIIIVTVGVEDAARQAEAAGADKTTLEEIDIKIIQNSVGSKEPSKKVL